MDNVSLIYREFGDPLQRLQLYTGEKFPLQPNEILVKMIASPINPSDLIPIRGAYSHRIKLPSVAGYDGVGIVVDHGKDVSGSIIGKRVLPVRGEGTWQQYVTTKSYYAIEVPPSISDEDASQLYINPLTAWFICTESLRVQPNEMVLMNGGGTSIAGLFAQISSILGFRLIVITRNSRKVSKLQKLGAWRVIDASKGSISEQISDCCGRSVDHAIDSVGGESGELLAGALKPQGTFISFGLLSGIPNDWRKFHDIYRVSPQLFALRLWNERHSVSEYRNRFSEVIKLFESGRMVMNAPEKIYDFEDFHDALKHYEQPGLNGKILLNFAMNKEM
ncbi:zinc-dependent alcohol dehydrogenase family protein [Bacillus atrophaeus]|uniref:zinc-dependent alcohol dehydrogenase family protein n=1 Tax=Bacillus atrophaeus TaxID=1452 RepID=UPI00227F2FFF|nr:zinc-dependent alcohol dehydrogenase family protein [Bacillus atrophaeus]MCY9206323.1 zinc-dependent alcohol dehydrogenase family protein [Bacillus atrophaeus]MEC0768514.1 zinc-dependent alcohol dehydrogenase family protein [Bacillus atrophaeus]MEC0778883.1 zinc-dependent alcohol dehydrogenase family protein [Bacillus atrophaeus]MEC0807658.1 zinc-dependent alcohol dehydrogenase family protein [Bacillus atrophaeus]MEC0883482.1 zinc-dependent alcohol dehydrogenase family protein [Bacillus atr